MKLKELKVGEIGTVVGFSTTDPAYRQKLLRMGLTRNADFTVVRKAPFGGPIEIEVKSFRLVLRSNEADALEVEKK
ncbi:MAG: ferrous iron transport protein A [Kiritimatiellales bacterium]|nr:ferrous iron transport protein A [Kiritimatiellales bacterium]MCF7864718.1 ferrous iron transport protein A [Kiritimatiellales bacterium]